MRLTDRQQVGRPHWASHRKGKGQRGTCWVARCVIAAYRYRKIHSEKADHQFWNSAAVNLSVVSLFVSMHSVQITEQMFSKVESTIGNFWADKRTSLYGDKKKKCKNEYT